MNNCCRGSTSQTPTNSGNAYARPTSCHRKTLYDNFSNFQRFKQSKEEEEALRSRKEELMKFNTKFTNWELKITNGKDEFDQFSTQDIARFRQQLRAHNCSKLRLAGTFGSSVSSPRNRKLKKKMSILAISHTPVLCPISSCKSILGVTSVLSHFLLDHGEEFGVQSQEIFIGKRSVLIFDVMYMNFRDTICLGVLAYGGPNKHKSTSPAERGICMYNAFLPKPQEHLEAHMPILIMGCKTSWDAMLRNKEVEAKVTDPKKAENHLFAIWLVGVQTTKPVYCTVTVYDKAMAVSRSTIVKLRHLNESQDPSQFLIKDSNYMRLCNGEIEILSWGASECVHMELMINEYR